MPTLTLPSGRVVEAEMPDLFTIMGQVGNIPDPVTAAVIDLLTNEGSLKKDGDSSKYRNKADQIRGLYGIALHTLVRPRVDLRAARGDGVETLGRLDLPIGDLEHIYYSFCRLGDSAAALPAGEAADAGGAPVDLSGGNSV